MSTAKGGGLRKRPQKYQNKTAFKNDLHDTSHKIKLLNSLEVSGVCKRCKDIIEWKIKYKKYKPLSAPRKCVNCEQRSIKHAYHLFCEKCAASKKACAKCCKSIEDVLLETDGTGLDLTAMLKGIPERKKRTILRFINKQSDEQKLTPDIMAQIESIVNEVDKVSLDEDFSSETDNEEE